MGIHIVLRLRGEDAPTSKGGIAAVRSSAPFASGSSLEVAQMDPWTESDRIASTRLRGSGRSSRCGSSADRRAFIVAGGRPVRSAFPAASRWSTAIIGDVPNTERPVAANARTEDNDHQSVVSSDSAPSMISGAMKPGVPMTSPVRVTWLWFSLMAMPKSTSTGPRAEIITLPGLMSRWMMPAA